jgi:IS5 family transposase
MGGKQLGFGDYEQSTAKKQTKREKFLAEMDHVVPWQPSPCVRKVVHSV